MRLPTLISVRSVVKRFTIPVLACVGMAAIAMPVLAQQAPATTAEPEPVLQEVVVTGSRIPVPANISATSPTTVVSSQDIKVADLPTSPT